MAIDTDRHVDVDGVVDLKLVPFYSLIVRNGDGSDTTRHTNVNPNMHTKPQLQMQRVTLMCALLLMLMLT